ncbi:integrase [Gossypium australe]|uniref:Integrase n=1 Tax=Gossypium australe TaxID=47621 RepID=A0A5B6VKG1_9ROSI|nr:integrase [Gossypium australe]
MHLKGNKMYQDLRELYWWPGLKRDVTEYWERLTMVFFSRLPLTQTKKDLVWVIVDRLTNSTHFLPVSNNCSLHKLARLYISEIVKLHGVLVPIIFDRNPRFTYRFWRKLHEALGTQLNFSTTFHP